MAQGRKNTTNNANDDAEYDLPLADTTTIRTIAFIKEFIVEDGR
jgi:hypothetical protein